MRIFLKTEDEIKLMRNACQLVVATLGELVGYIKPGVSTLQLDKIAGQFIRDHKAIPAFEKYLNSYGESFSASISTSINDTVVNGIPSDETLLKEGDIISISCGALLDGFNGYSCYTFSVGEVKPEIKCLLRVTKESLRLGIENAVAGKHVGDIGCSIGSFCEASGYCVVPKLGGHGIGREMNEDPKVPNCGNRGEGLLLRDGICLTVEPVIAMGHSTAYMKPNHWTMVTQDGQPAAHFAQTIVVRRGMAEILSSFDKVEQLEANK